MMAKISTPRTSRTAIMTMARRRLHLFLHGVQGVAAIEFAIVGGVFSMLLVVGGDLGMAYYSNMQVQTSAQVGAEYAAMNGFNVPTIRTAVVNATAATGISASPDPVQFTGCPSAGSI